MWHFGRFAERVAHNRYLYSCPENHTPNRKAQPGLGSNSGSAHLHLLLWPISSPTGPRDPRFCSDRAAAWSWFDVVSLCFSVPSNTENKEKYHELDVVHCCVAHKMRSHKDLLFLIWWSTPTLKRHAAQNKHNQGLSRIRPNQVLQCKNANSLLEQTMENSV